MNWIEQSEEYSKQMIWREVDKPTSIIYTLKSGMEIFIENPSHLSADDKFVYWKNDNSFYSVLIEDVSACSSTTSGETK